MAENETQQGGANTTSAATQGQAQNEEKPKGRISFALFLIMLILWPAGHIIGGMADIGYYHLLISFVGGLLFLVLSYLSLFRFFIPRKIFAVEVEEKKGIIVTKGGSFHAMRISSAIYALDENNNIRPKFALAEVKDGKDEEDSKRQETDGPQETEKLTRKQKKEKKRKEKENKKRKEKRKENNRKKILGGIWFYGLPDLHKVYSYRQRWSTLKPGKTIRSYDEVLPFFWIPIDWYVLDLSRFTIDGKEQGIVDCFGNAIDLKVLVQARIYNGERAVLGVTGWISMMHNIIAPVVMSFAPRYPWYDLERMSAGVNITQIQQERNIKDGNATAGAELRDLLWNEFVKSLQPLGASRFQHIKKPDDNNPDWDIDKEGEAVIVDGVKIFRADFTIFDVDPSEAVRATYNAPHIAELEGKKNVAEEEQKKKVEMVKAEALAQKDKIQADMDKVLATVRADTALVKAEMEKKTAILASEAQEKAQELLMIGYYKAMLQENIDKGVSPDEAAKAASVALKDRQYLSEDAVKKIVIATESDGRTAEGSPSSAEDAIKGIIKQVVESGITWEAAKEMLSKLLASPSSQSTTKPTADGPAIVKDTQGKPTQRKRRSAVVEDIMRRLG